MNPRQRDQVRQDKSASTRFLSASMSISDLREEEGVFESIKIRRQYDYLVREGFIRVSQAYARQRILCPTLADFRSAHTQIFGAVSAEAGRIRDEECLVQIFGEFLEDCDLEGEFSLLGSADLCDGLQDHDRPGQGGHRGLYPCPDSGGAAGDLWQQAQGHV